MTPTPQERTELQRLADVLRWASIDLTGSNDDSTKTWWMLRAKDFARTLIPLAAQSEELRAENERRKKIERADTEFAEEQVQKIQALQDEANSAHKRGYEAGIDDGKEVGINHALFFFEEDIRGWQQGIHDRDALLERIRDVWRKTKAERDSALESRRTLESRYSALETVCREMINSSVPMTAYWQKISDALALLEASDQGVQG